MKKATPDPMANILSQQEMQGLILAFATQRGAAGFTTAEATALLSEARFIRLQATCLDLAIRGALLVDWRDGAPVWCHKEP